MKLLIVICLLTNFLFSQEIDENKYYATTKTVFIPSEVFNKEREIQIYLPDEYFKEPNRSFKTLYLFDAQNQRIFNYVKGNVELLGMNYIEPLIIVGVVTEDRWFEFLPINNHAETLKEYEPPIGGADSLIIHIKNEIEPYINQNFRTLESKIGMGHSLGGTFLMYFNTVDPNFFDASVLLSPNFSYDEEQMLDRIKNCKAADQEKEFYVFSGYGDKYEMKFNKSLKKINKWLRKNSKKNLVWEYENLSISDHGKIWLEGVYKGLLKIKTIQRK